MTSFGVKSTEGNNMKETPRQQAIGMAVSAIEMHMYHNDDWLLETVHGRKVMQQLQKLSNQLRRKIGADEVEVPTYEDY